MAGSLEIVVVVFAFALLAALVALFFIQQKRHAQENDALRDEGAALRKASEALRAENSALREKVAQLQRLCDVARRGVQGAQKVAAVREKEVAALRKERTDLRNVGDALRAENAMLREKRSSLEQLLYAARDKAEKAGRELAERETKLTSLVKCYQALARQPQPQELATGVAVGIGGRHAMELRMLHDGGVLAGARRLDSSVLKDALAAVPQALPSLVLAEQVAGTHLMEVVIDGSLVRAADGAGFRAFAMGPNGIEQQARLFDAGGLQTLAVGTMIWQIAAIALGQKYLVDIKRELRRIAEGLERVLGFLQGDRRARILADWRYVQNVVRAAEAGELAEGTRQELETIERELTQAMYSLHADFDATVRRPLEEGGYGSDVEFASLKKQLDENRSIFEDMNACIEVRQACCYAASLFPGSRVLLEQRLEGLRKDTEDFHARAQHVKAHTESQAASITAFWNSEGTLAARRAEVYELVGTFAEAVDQSRLRQENRAEQIAAVVAALDKPRKLYVTVQDQKVVEVHEPDVAAG